MTIKYHASAKGPNGELVGVQAEGVGDNIYSEFMGAVQDLGLEYALEAAKNPGAAPQPQQQPARPSQQQPQSNAGVPGAPRCHHGPKTRRTGTNNRGDWVGWFCPSPKGTPDQCKPEFEDN